MKKHYPSGPRTEDAKRRTRGNAVRHGLLAQTIVVIKSETVYSWRMHLDRVIADLRPQGYIQEVLAERIAMIIWRQARVIRYEAGSIESSQDALKAFTLDASTSDITLPETNVLEQVHRYEQHLSREFGRAMREFDACRERALADTGAIEGQQVPARQGVDFQESSLYGTIESERD